MSGLPENKDPATKLHTQSDLSALSVEVQKLKKYYHANRDTFLEAFNPAVTYLAAGQHLAASDNLGLRAVGLWTLGRCLGSPSETLSFDLHRDGVERELNERQFFLEALRCDPQFYHAYRSLGACLEPGEAVTIDGPRKWNERELYLETLRYNPDCSEAYYNLGVALAPKETVVLHDGRTLGDRQLYTEALRCNASNSHGYNNLALTLTPGESVVLHDGRSLSKRELYIESLHCDPGNFQAFNNLAVVLPAGETVMLPDGRTLNRRGLYLEALRIDPNDRRLHKVQAMMHPQDNWTRQYHIVFRGRTNRLFATLLLGVQRLEEAGLLELAHQAMLEDMFEYWTWADQ